MKLHISIRTTHQWLQLHHSVLEAFSKLKSKVAFFWGSESSESSKLPGSRVPAASCSHKCNLWATRCPAGHSEVLIKTPASHLKLQPKCCVCFPLYTIPWRFSFSTEPFWSWLQSRQCNLPVEGIWSWGEGNPSPQCRGQNWAGGFTVLPSQPFHSGACPALEVLLW